MARPEKLNQHGKHIIDDLNMVHVYKCVSNGRNDVMAHQRVLISCCLLTQWEHSPRRHQHRTRPGLNLRSVNMETWGLTLIHESYLIFFGALDKS